MPRTFLGAMAIAMLSSPQVALARVLGASKHVVQILVRLILLASAWHGLRGFAAALQRRAGPDASRYFWVLLSVSPHFLFYASRTLPNSFATIVGTNERI